MDLLELIKHDHSLAGDLKQFCDIEILPEMERISSNFTYNISGTEFGFTSSNGKYILLDDNTIAFDDLSEGWLCGRMAENITEFFELVINIPDWTRFFYNELYKNEEILEKHIKIVEKKHGYNESIHKNMQKKLLEKLSIKELNKTALLKRFYISAVREPQWECTYFKHKGFNTEIKENRKTKLVRRIKGLFALRRDSGFSEPGEPDRTHSDSFIHYPGNETVYRKTEKGGFITEKCLINNNKSLYELFFEED